MAILSTILSMFGASIIDKIFGTVTDVIKQWQTKQITEIEAKQAIKTSLIGAVKEVEIAQADSITKTYATMMDAVKENKMVSIVWTITTLSQLAILLWHQAGIPFLVYAYRTWWGMTTFNYPPSGTTVEWAYGLLMGLLGLGAIALRGSSTSGVVDRFKKLEK